jgi:signal transduction histidine kinase
MVIRFSPGNVDVWLTVRDLSTIHVEIRDERLGITPEDLTKIFEPSVRVANATNIDGTGLGLSIVKKAVDLIGGSITMASKTGRRVGVFGDDTDTIKLNGIQH